MKTSTAFEFIPQVTPMGTVFDGLNDGNLIMLGRDVFSMLNPPDKSFLNEFGKLWKIGRNGSGSIVLRAQGECHPQFINGMGMGEFVEWINGQLR